MGQKNRRWFELSHCWKFFKFIQT